MLVLKWTAEHECRRQVSGDGLKATIHVKKGGCFQFPESAESVMRKQFSDALSCVYCTIERVEQISGWKKAIEIEEE